VRGDGPQAVLDDLGMEGGGIGHGWGLGIRTQS
jgi:hypothetical protein